MREIMNIVNHETQRRRGVKGFPFALARLKAFFLQFLPKPLLTRIKLCS